MRVFSKREEIVPFLKAAGLGRVADRLSEAALPTVVFGTAPRDDHDIPIGASKFGGAPDLPAGMEWPARKPYEEGSYAFRTTLLDRLARVKPLDKLVGLLGPRPRDPASLERPLAFVAQIDLAGAATTRTVDPMLPDHGLLSLFYDVECMPWGFHPGDGRGFRLFWFDHAPAALHRAAPPPQEPLVRRQFASFPAASLALRGGWTLPGDDDELKGCGLDDDAAETFGEAMEAESPDNPPVQHRIGGWADTIQSDMRFGCGFVTRGHDIGAADDKSHPDHAAAVAEVPEWRLVLQIDSDDSIGMKWVDGGRLYVLMRREDIARRAFERAWLVLQTT